MAAKRGALRWMEPERVVRQTLAVPPSRSLRLAVVADTHSVPHPAVFGLLARERPAAVLHAGDIGELRVLDRLATVAPVIAVRGNIDLPNDPPDAIELALDDGGTRLLTILLLHIAVRGPRLTTEAVKLARVHGANLVVCGHSHVPLIAATAGIAVFNPGSIGPRRFTLPITFGMIEIAPTGVSFRHIDCESGEEWRPSGAGVH